MDGVYGKQKEKYSRQMFMKRHKENNIRWWHQSSLKANGNKKIFHTSENCFRRIFVQEFSTWKKRKVVVIKIFWNCYTIKKWHFYLAENNASSDIISGILKYHKDFILTYMIIKIYFYFWNVLYINSFALFWFVILSVL